MLTTFAAKREKNSIIFRSYTHEDMNRFRNFIGGAEIDFSEIPEDSDIEIYEDGTAYVWHNGNSSRLLCEDSWPADDMTWADFCNALELA